VKCTVCAGGALACKPLVVAAIATPTPLNIGAALSFCGGGVWACMECIEDLELCGHWEKAKEAVRLKLKIQRATCPLREIYEAICNYVEGEVEEAASHRS